MYPDTHLLIDGVWGAAQGGKSLPVLNPATGGSDRHRRPCRARRPGSALAAAQKGFETWRPDLGV
ncbi:MAG: hypothetical protein WDN49_24320 [Acetobacteraceae bacterium]